MRSIFLIITLIFILLLGGCVDIKDESLEFRQVVLSLSHNDPSRRNFKINDNLTLGIGMELIKLVPESEKFVKDPSDLSMIYDTTLSDLPTNKVSLRIPLRTSVKLFAYRYSENLSEKQIQLTSNVPVSFGESNTFVVKEDTKSLTITLMITPNGIPGLTVEQNDNQTSDKGYTSSVMIALKTHPKEDVTIPIKTDFGGVLLSTTSLVFTPLNWSSSQTVTLKGIDNPSIELSQNYIVKLGNMISEDLDYSKIVPQDLSFGHQILIKPVIKEITSINSLINDTTPTYTFSSTKRGTISFGGSCTSDNKTASVGNNTISFAELSDSTYNNCTISVTDLAGNTSDNLSINSFTVDTVAPQLESMTLDNGSNITDQNLSVLSTGFKATFNEPMKESTMQVNDSSSGEIKINCSSANTFRLGSDNSTDSGEKQCRELAQMTSVDKQSWTTLIKILSNTYCQVTDNLTGTPTGSCSNTLVPGTDYKLILTTEVTDLAGNSLIVDNTTLFRTRNYPSVISSFPDNGSDNNSLSLAPVFHFDKSMDPGSFMDNVSVNVNCNPIPQSGSNCNFSSFYHSASDNLTINPIGQWPDNTTVTVTLKGRNGNFPFSGVYEQTDGIFMDSDYVVHFKTITDKSWKLIAKQTGDENDIPLFSSNARNDYLQNDNDSSNSTYMSIGNINPFDYLDDGKYRFKLIWGGLEVVSSGINRIVEWTQTSWLDNSTITGFSEIGTSDFVTGVRKGFEGLGKSDNENCVIDGNADSSGNNDWWNCVGAINKYKDSIPGPLGKKASSMHLYIRSPSSGIFSKCENKWCLQDGPTKPQYTMCESLDNGGNTCMDPQIKYGNVEGGIPAKHSGNKYDTWCEQLGGSYKEHTEGTRTGSPLFGCASYDETNIWHWCDWQDGKWYNQSLGLSNVTKNNYINSITCN